MLLGSNPNSVFKCTARDCTQEKPILCEDILNVISVLTRMQLYPYLFKNS